MATVFMAGLGVDMVTLVGYSEECGMMRLLHWRVCHTLSVHLVPPLEGGYRPLLGSVDVSMV